MKTSKIILLLSAILLSIPSSISAAYAESEEPAFDRNNIIDNDNYLPSAGSTISSDENGLTITGSASYNLGFNFEQNTDHKIKLKFNIDEITPTGEAWIVFHKDPNDILGCADNDIPGYYIRIQNNNYDSWIFDAYYTDGINYKCEVLGTSIITQGDCRRDHTIQFETSLIQGYTDGVRCFYHGVHYGDWLGYSRVKNRNLTNNFNQTFLSMGGATMTITDIFPGDITAPKITYKNPEQEFGYPNEEYILGDITVYDEIDKDVPYTIKLTDTSNKDITSTLYKNGQNKLCFSPLEAGEYIFRISSTDYSYNTSSKRIYINVINRPHYPQFIEVPAFNLNARRSEKYYFPIPNAQDITEDGNEKDNNISYQYTGYYYSDSGEKRDLDILHDEKGYYFNPEDYEAYKNDGVGNYFLRIKATNSYGSTYFEKEVWVKYDIVNDDAFKEENMVNKFNWNYTKLMSFEDDRVGISGNTYYKAGLPLEKGIKINFSIIQLIDKSTTDNWFSFALLKHPGQAKYGDRECGLYFMFFYQNGAFRYNLQYVLSNGDYIDIKNNEALYSNIPDNIELEVTPFDITLDASMDDNIDINFDKTKVESYEVYKVLRSEFEDDEKLVYLSFGYSNSGTQGTTWDNTTNPKYYINSIDYTDKTAPTIVLDENVPTNVTANTEITLPNAIGIDETDGRIEASLLSVTRPDNKGITVINKKFTPIYNGIYTVTYMATDNSGNATTLVKEITVTGGKDIKEAEKTGCNGNIISVSFIVPFISLIAIGVFIKKKKED